MKPMETEGFQKILMGNRQYEQILIDLDGDGIGTTC